MPPCGSGVGTEVGVWVGRRVGVLVGRVDGAGVGQVRGTSNLARTRKQSLVPVILLHECYEKREAYGEINGKLLYLYKNGMRLDICLRMPRDVYLDTPGPLTCIKGAVIACR